ncbi:hypothetical protein JTE90_005287 [Oedothorax gibbosus]|uniref:C2H2-type domain-containing protein n=1 Tax=Oedothorax gibbosus TaxID=931172 RepID=A0AAV6U2H5_9ARAC|nr:hypothetical protein JTE90_005287 [Oedothorax gibbosus]
MAQTSSTIEMMKNSSSDESISSSSDTRYTCVKCQKAFKKRRHCYRHIRRHRNYQPLVPTQPYICKFCGDVYKHERHLREHESTHVKYDDEGFPINDWLEKFMKNSSNLSESVYHVIMEI